MKADEQELERLEADLRQRLAALEVRTKQVERDLNPLWYFAIFAVVGFTAAMIFLGVTS